SAAASSPACVPAMTTWPGALSFATQTPSSPSQTRSATSTSAPTRAAMPPGLASADACESRARSAASRNPSARSTAPEAMRAVIWPREWPANATGSSSRSAVSASHATSEPSSTASWLASVVASSAAPASRSRRASGRSSTASASPTTDQAGWSTHASPAPGVAAPWPGKITAYGTVWGPPARFGDTVPTTGSGVGYTNCGNLLHIRRNVGGDDVGDRRYRAAELADAVGISVQLLRSYQSKGLLPPPRHEGRVAWYGDHHRARLLRILDLKGRGYSLRAIGEVLDGDTRPLDDPAAVVDEHESLRLTDVADRSGVPVEMLRALEAS